MMSGDTVPVLLQGFYVGYRGCSSTLLCSVVEFLVARTVYPSLIITLMKHTMGFQAIKGDTGVVLGVCYPMRKNHLGVRMDFGDGVIIIHDRP